MKNEAKQVLGIILFTGGVLGIFFVTLLHGDLRLVGVLLAFVAMLAGIILMSDFLFASRNWRK